MRLLVTGATGFVGSRLVPALLEAGHEVYALTRDATGYEGPDEARVVEGNILDPETYKSALAEVDAAYYLIHSMGSGTDFAERDRRAAHNFVRATEGTDLDRVVYLGGLGEERERLSKHLQSRREVESILAEGTYDLTTLRAAIVIGAGSQSFEMIRQLTDRLPVMITPKWVRTECQPIAISDVVTYLVGVLDVSETAGETFEIGGPEVLSYQVMLERTGEILDRRLFVLPVPVLSPKISAYWVDLVTDVPKSVAHPLILGLENRVVVEDHRVEQLLAFERTPFDLAVKQALGTEHEPPIKHIAARAQSEAEQATAGAERAKAGPERTESEPERAESGSERAEPDVGPGSEPEPRPGR
jgi:uncharacterized protein YbjT (DUF2867 family)